VVPATGGVVVCAPVDAPSVAFIVTGLASADFAPVVVGAALVFFALCGFSSWRPPAAAGVSLCVLAAAASAFALS
jgi:hypothetical protein